MKRIINKGSTATTRTKFSATADARNKKTPTPLLAMGGGGASGFKRAASIITACLAACAIFGGNAMATEYTWVHTTGGTRDWKVAANWIADDGSTDSFPNAPGDIVRLIASASANQSISLKQDITIGKLFYESENGSITIQNAAGEKFCLTFDNGSEDITIDLGKVGKPNYHMNVPTAFNSDVTLNMSGVDANNRSTLTINQPVDLRDHTMTITGGTPDWGNYLAIGADGDFTSGTIEHKSGIQITFTGRKSFPGTVILSGRANAANTSVPMTFIGGGLTNAAEIVLYGMMLNSRANNSGAWIACGSSSFADDNLSPRLSVKKVTFNGSSLKNVGQTPRPITDDPATHTPWRLGQEWCDETIGSMDFQSGYNLVAVEHPVNLTQGTRMFVENISRERGASVFLDGKYLNNLEMTNRCLFVENGAALSKGAGGAAGTTKMSIIPWMSVNTTNPGDRDMAHSMVYYDALIGFRALADAEYVKSLTTAAPEDNVSVAGNSPFVDTDMTINSLRVAGNNNYENNYDLLRNGMRLTLASGGLSFVRTHTLGNAGNPSGSIIDFGGEEGVITVSSTVPAFLGYSLAGTNGVTKALTGILTLTALNDTLSGPVHVGGGILRVGNGTDTSNLGASDVIDIHAGATLRISSDNAIDNTATVFIRSLVDDLYTGKIEIDAGLEERVKYLCIGGVGMPAGTYGSLASAADYQMDDFFAGAGTLIVTRQFGEELKASIIVVR